MNTNFDNETSCLRAKKRVKNIKGFYVHALIYVIVNIFISGIIIFALLKGGRSFSKAILNFGVYSSWIFWGIGVFFHWLGVFGFKHLGFGKNWEEKKIKELMEKDDEKRNNIF